MSWRINTKPEQFSSGAPWCSWTTTGGFVYCEVAASHYAAIAPLSQHVHGRLLLHPPAEASLVFLDKIRLHITKLPLGARHARGPVLRFAPHQW